jgi:hypothetical protein
MQALAQDFGILALNAGRHGLADEWEGLVTIETAQLQNFAV